MATATALNFGNTQSGNTHSGNTQSREGHPWLAASIWLAFLGPFFFLSYGIANWLATQRASVPSVMFGWEHRTPFLPWTIVPYWTSDFLYVASLFVCTTRRELDIHAKRLLAAQLISVVCFLAFPLHCAFERPDTTGFFGWLFTVLLGFDKPFNQAPSLHVSLAVILWGRFAAHLEGFWRTMMGAWLTLVVLSTMTTYQHQFLDLPTGALAGLLAIAVIPDKSVWDAKAQRMRLATFYLSGTSLALAIAIKAGGPAWVLLWPAAAALTVAIAYAANWPGLLRIHVIRVIVAPYTLAAWINSRLWTRRIPAANEIVDGVWLGRAPAFTGEAKDFRSIVSLAAELHLRARTIPALDLVTPSSRQVQDAVAAIEDAASKRPTLVCCALGMERSAAAVAAWLVSSGRAPDMASASAMIRQRRPQVKLNGDHSAERV